MRDSRIDSIFNCKSLALFGSVSEGKLGRALIERLIDGGFDMKNVYVINPKGAGHLDSKGYKSVSELADKKVDLALIASPAETVPQVLEECGEAGINSAVIISSGFSEAGNNELEKKLVEAAQKYSIRFIGPNCAGVANTKNSLLATIEAKPSMGGISLISQSGAVGGLIMHLSTENGLGICKFASYGNGADLNETSLLEYLIDDESTDVITLYVENIKDGRRFMEVLRKATAVKPVIIIKSGRTSSGQRAAMSHTGSMAGADMVYDAAISACGGIRAITVDEMFDYAKIFAAKKQMAGKKVAIITNSGGPGVMTADMCENAGLTVCAPTDSLKSKLQEFLPSYAGLANPIDLTVGATPEGYAKALSACLEEYDAAIVMYVGTPHLQALPVANELAKVARNSDKCICALFEIGSDIEEAKQVLKDSGIVLFPSGERAANALSKLAEYEQHKANRREINLCPDVESMEISCHCGRTSLLETQAMRLLDSVGISIPKNFFAANNHDVVKACNEIGYPVCMKVLSSDIIHKSDVGGVILNIKNDFECTEAFNRLSKLQGFIGVIVYPMLDKGFEVMMGFVRDAQFGPVMMFGMGGIYTEVLKDVALGIAPLNYEAALELIKSTKCYEILKGARGGKKADIDALCDILVKLSMLPFMYENIQEADINPVFAYEDGAVVADARILLSTGDKIEKEWC
ncbi:MAG TPA: CoA-binding protein [Clostridiales bacterium]|jgi:acyl-CoA synthetase (NDP forming)|nr:CoA-binding protein [Clostridiales bacterium]